VARFDLAPVPETGNLEMPLGQISVPSRSSNRSRRTGASQPAVASLYSRGRTERQMVLRPNRPVATRPVTTGTKSVVAEATLIPPVIGSALVTDERDTRTPTASVPQFTEAERVAGKRVEIGQNHYIPG
jgi:hypothetical protein